jgi:curved DNA-binding protein
MSARPIAVIANLSEAWIGIPGLRRIRLGGAFAMSDGEPFVDFYDILQVDPNCDARTLDAAYHRLAKMYHPDHTGSADTAKFSSLSEAYKALRNRNKRKKYDLLYFRHFPARVPKSPPEGEPSFEEGPALDDAEAHARILAYLYKKRRENAQNAGVVGFYLQDMLQCSDEHFDFHKWYLKEKGFIVLTEQGTLAITIQGVDHVIAMSRTAKAERLLLGQARHGPHENT